MADSISFIPKVYDLDNFVQKIFNKSDGLAVNTEDVVEEFNKYISNYTDDQLVEILNTAGYIPDLYAADSSQETLYTKLCEILEVNWATRMGYKSEAKKQKASYEDVLIKIDGAVVVSDTKTFRLARSQAAPNVKDFVKPEDYDKWISRYKEEKLGGLVVYPQLHEWKNRSDAYSYCSNKNNPILMLPFHYLGFLLLLKNQGKLDPTSLKSLWNYERIFPNQVTNRGDYWKSVNKTILEISEISSDDLYKYMKKAELKMYKYVILQNAKIESTVKDRVSRIESEILNMDANKLREEYKKYKISTETDLLKEYSKRIKKFRLSGDSTIYSDYIPGDK